METTKLPEDLAADVAAIGRIVAVPNILDVVCRATGMGFAAVARVTDSRWVVCAVHDDISFGLVPGAELALQTTICDEIRGSGEPVVIDNVAEDKLYCRHPTPALYGFQSYISMPIYRTGGAFFGTLCAIDPRPARVSRPEVVEMFRLFADLIAFHLEAQERVTSSEAALGGEREAAELREQFIAVLGHDLRNPLAAIQSGTHLLQRHAVDAKASRIIELIQDSVTRMTGLIDDVLDFARGRLGGGFGITRDPRVPLRPALEQAVNELRAAWPDRTIEMVVSLPETVNCDAARMAQMLSNLVANALSHGAEDGVVKVAARMDAHGILHLEVGNQGDPIEPEMLKHLFEPYFRVKQRTGSQGLGLGLYIAAEIARAHGGTLQAISTKQETRFSARIPVG